MSLGKDTVKNLINVNWVNQCLLSLDWFLTTIMGKFGLQEIDGGYPFRCIFHPINRTLGVWIITHQKSFSNTLEFRPSSSKKMSCSCVSSRVCAATSRHFKTLFTSKYRLKVLFKSRPSFIQVLPRFRQVSI